MQEVEKLFEMMRMLKEQGIALIYTSHKMDEIFEICDEISVLRDGNLVMTKSTEDTDTVSYTHLRLMIKWNFCAAERMIM